MILEWGDCWGSIDVEFPALRAAHTLNFPHPITYYPSYLNYASAEERLEFSRYLLCSPLTS